MAINDTICSDLPILAPIGNTYWCTTVAPFVDFFLANVTSGCAAISLAMGFADTIDNIHNGLLDESNPPATSQTECGLHSWWGTFEERTRRLRRITRCKDMKGLPRESEFDIDDGPTHCRGVHTTDISTEFTIFCFDENKKITASIFSWVVADAPGIISNLTTLKEQIRLACEAPPPPPGIPPADPDKCCQDVLSKMDNFISLLNQLFPV